MYFRVLRRYLRTTTYCCYSLTNYSFFKFFTFFALRLLLCYLNLCVFTSDVLIALKVLLALNRKTFMHWKFLNGTFRFQISVRNFRILVFYQVEGSCQFVCSQAQELDHIISSVHHFIFMVKWRWLKELHFHTPC